MHSWARCNIIHLVLSLTILLLIISLWKQLTHRIGITRNTLPSHNSWILSKKSIWTSLGNRIPPTLTKWKPLTYRNHLSNQILWLNKISINCFKILKKKSKLKQKPRNSTDPVTDLLEETSQMSSFWG